VGERIKVGQIEINYLLDGSKNGGSIGMFEFTVPPGAKVPVPHYHRDYDETVYGLSGVLTLTVDGADTEVGPGAHLFIRRGAVHHFVNRHAESARVLAVLTPDLIGPAFFREMGALITPGVPPDPAKMSEVMLRYGLVPVPQALTP
jgi:quercetin dioxygenase-like cupin family protein